MDKKHIQSILKDAVEHEVPASTVDLLPNVKERLVAGTNQQGEKMNSTNPRRMSRVALASLAVFALLAMAFITPQGRALAQDLLQFFTRAESNSFPVEPEVSLPVSTAIPPDPFISVAEAEARAGFDIVELPYVPEGFNFLGARMYGNDVSLEYEAQGGGGNLTLSQSKYGFLQSQWDQVPAEAVVPVMIGDANGEFAKGAFVVMAGETTAHWSSSVPILRLRWMKDGVWFALSKFGDVESIAYLDQDALIALAATMTNKPTSASSSTDDTQDANKLVPFTVLSPLVVPDGITLQATSFDPALQMVSLSYGYASDDLRLLIKQQPVESQETCSLCGLVGASASVQQVQINDVPGEYAEGVWELTDNGPVWRDDPYLKTLRWQANGMAYELVYMGTELEKEQLVDIASSMR